MTRILDCRICHGHGHLMVPEWCKWTQTYGIAQPRTCPTCRGSGYLDENDQPVSRTQAMAYHTIQRAMCVKQEG